LNEKRHELTSERSGIEQADILAVEVPAISLSCLLESERVEHLDLLQIDTEGYDIKYWHALICRATDLPLFGLSMASTAEWRCAMNFVMHYFVCMIMVIRLRWNG
jgi:hypothetical protein